MNKDQKRAFIGALKHRGFKVTRGDGKILVRKDGELVSLVELKVNSSIVISWTAPWGVLVRALLYKALA